MQMELAPKNQKARCTLRFLALGHALPLAFALKDMIHLFTTLIVIIGQVLKGAKLSHSCELLPRCSPPGLISPKDQHGDN